MSKVGCGSGGRPKHESWDKLNFTLSRNENGRHVAFCNVCNKFLQNTASERLITHRKNCISTLTKSDQNNGINKMDISNQTLNETQNSNLSVMMTEDICENNNNNSISVDNSNIPDFESKSFQQMKIKSFFDQISDREKTIINDALSELIFGCNIDMEVIESDYFIKLVKSLRPAYSPPKSEEMSSFFLHKIAKKLQEQNLKLKIEPGVLLTSVQSIGNDKRDVQFFTRDLHGNTSFLTSAEISVSNTYDEEIRDITSSSIDLARNALRLDIWAIVSKECSLQCFNQEKILSLPCNIKIAHSIGDCLTNNNLYQKTRSILMECLEFVPLMQDLKHVPPSAESSNKNTWEVHQECYLFLISNIQELKKVNCENSYEFKEEVVKLLFDRSFETTVRESFEIYNSISALITKLKAEDFSIADAVEEWLSLYEETSSDKLRSTIEEHSFALFHPASVTANHLHPVYRGRKLTKNQLSNAHEFLLENLEKDGLEEYTIYKEEKGLFFTLLKKNIKSPLVFWKMTDEKYPNLSNLSKKLFKIPASSLDMKNHFQGCKKLPREKLAMLKNVYYNLRLKDSKILL